MNTTLADLINPQVMADMISAKIESAIKIVPYAKLDTTLQGNPGDTITVPRYAYIGDAVDVAEGEQIPLRKMATSTASYKVKKAGNGVSLTDEAVLSGYGDPVGNANNQLAKSVTSRTDIDGIEALYEATTSYTGTGVISYENTVNGIDLFEEEMNSDKVKFIHPKQVTQLRLDPNFISADKYNNNVIMKGEIGMIANTRIVPTKKVKNDGTYYLNPVVKVNNDVETEDDLPALTFYLKRDTNVETARDAGKKLTEIYVDKHYVIALTNEEKVLIIKNAMATV